MTVRLRQAENIYDLLAFVSSYILNCIQETPYEFYDFNDNDFVDVYDAVEKYVIDIDMKGHKIAFNIFRRFVLEFLKNGINIEKCYAIVRYIDELVVCEINEGLYAFEEFIKYDTLSKRSHQEIRIIPKMKNTLLLRNGEFLLKDPVNDKRSLYRNTGECSCSALDEVTLNYMVWDKENLQRFPMKIYRTRNSGKIGQHFNKRNIIKIGLVPLTCKNIEEVLNIKYSNNSFYVDGMKNEAKNILKERYIDAYNRSLSNDIDFLIYPEMLISGEFLDDLRIHNKMNGPQFIVNGSIWEDYSNKSILTDGKGNEIFKYYKKNPFKFDKNGKEYKEYLKKQIASEEYPILEIEGIGRIGLCICKDLMHETTLLFHKYLKTDLLLVPAFSKSFRLKADACYFAEKYNCLTVLVNSCAAYKEHWSDKEKKIGFLAFPAKEKNANIASVLTYSADTCETFCGQKCVGKLFTISFTEVASNGFQYSIDIKETAF